MKVISITPFKAVKLPHHPSISNNKRTKGSCEQSIGLKKIITSSMNSKMRCVVGCSEEQQHCLRNFVEVQVGSKRVSKEHHKSVRKALIQCFLGRGGCLDGILLNDVLQGGSILYHRRCPRFPFGPSRASRPAHVHPWP